MWLFVLALTISLAFGSICPPGVPLKKDHELEIFFLSDYTASTSKLRRRYSSSVRSFIQRVEAYAPLRTAGANFGDIGAKRNSPEDQCMVYFKNFRYPSNQPNTYVADKITANSKYSWTGNDDAEDSAITWLISANSSSHQRVNWTNDDKTKKFMLILADMVPKFAQDCHKPIVLQGWPDCYEEMPMQRLTNLQMCDNIYNKPTRQEFIDGLRKDISYILFVVQYSHNLKFDQNEINRYWSGLVQEMQAGGLDVKVYFGEAYRGVEVFLMDAVAEKMCGEEEPEVLEAEIQVCENMNVMECGCPELKYINYRGTINTTETGMTCQAWSSQFPNRHSFTPEKYPELVSNYCRNPGMAGDRPWCYTTGGGIDFCSVPACGSYVPTPPLPVIPDQEMPEEVDVDYDIPANPDLACPGAIPTRCGCRSVKMQDYIGTLNVTEDGATCVPWPNKELGNYCRNPMGIADRPWCFTGIGTWGFCKVPECGCRNANTTCQKPIVEQCGCGDYSGMDYRGTQNTTKSGYTCQNWNSNYPHRHGYKPANIAWIEAGLEGNYCRNPDQSSEGPWCYTTDPNKRTESCGIATC